jgi:hypothetical protein
MAQQHGAFRMHLRGIPWEGTMRPAARHTRHSTVRPRRITAEGPVMRFVDDEFVAAGMPRKTNSAAIRKRLSSAQQRFLPADFVHFFSGLMTLAGMLLCDFDALEMVFC